MSRRNPSAFLSTVGLGPDLTAKYGIAEVREGGVSVYYIVEQSSGTPLQGPWQSIHEATRQLARLTGNIERVRGTPFSVTQEEKYMRHNPNPFESEAARWLAWSRSRQPLDAARSNPRRQVERKPQSRQVQARSAMRPQRELERYDSEQAAHAAYVSGQHARHDATMAAGLAALEGLIPRVRAMMQRTPKKLHSARIHEMIYDSNLWEAAPLSWYDDRLINDYLLAAAAGDQKTSAALRPHVLGLFKDAREYAHVTERYPSTKYHPPLMNPKERFRSARAAKRGARGAAATQFAFDEHHEQFSHTLAEDRAERTRRAKERQSERLMEATEPDWYVR